MDITEINKL